MTVLLLVLLSVPAPQRIVTLAPSCAEVVAGLGLGERIVGVTDYTDWPERVRTLPKVGSFTNFSVEAVAALHPDLVVATDDGNPPAALHRLEQLGIRVVTMRLRSYEEIQRSITALGDAVGRRAEAQRIVAEMTRVADCVARRTHDVAHPRVLLAYELAPVVSAGAGTFTDQLITMAGGASITHDVATPFPRLSIESVIARHPQVIVVSSMNPQVDEQRATAALRKWTTAPIHVIDSTNVDRPSQRIVLGLTLLARTIHPALFAHGECRAELP
jgi:iron complex transport system substrate-binding protein